MITAKVGYEINEDLMQIEHQEEFETFEEANSWSSEVMKSGGYDTTQFEHSEGEEKMQEIIGAYIASL